MKPIKAGARASVIYGVGDPLCAKSKHAEHMHFLAHGMGLVSHEAPRLTTRMGYDAHDANLPLVAGMVISVETTLQHPKRGFIKLEDTVAVTETGHEVYGDGGRGWNRAGTAA
jgi:Xaa-Pro aminopeptidase